MKNVIKMVGVVVLMVSATVYASNPEATASGTTWQRFNQMVSAPRGSGDLGQQPAHTILHGVKTSRRPMKITAQNPAPCISGPVAAVVTLEEEECLTPDQMHMRYIQEEAVNLRNAIAKGKVDAVEELLERNKDRLAIMMVIDPRDGRTPYEYAQQQLGVQIGKSLNPQNQEKLSESMACGMAIQNIIDILFEELEREQELELIRQLVLVPESDPKRRQELTQQLKLAQKLREEQLNLAQKLNK